MGSLSFCSLSSSVNFNTRGVNRIDNHFHNFKFFDNIGINSILIGVGMACSIYFFYYFYRLLKACFPLMKTIISKLHYSAKKSRDSLFFQIAYLKVHFMIVFALIWKKIWGKPWKWALSRHGYETLNPPTKWKTKIVSIRW